MNNITDEMKRLGNLIGFGSMDIGYIKPHLLAKEALHDLAGEVVEAWKERQDYPVDGTDSEKANSYHQNLNNVLKNNHSALISLASERLRSIANLDNVDKLLLTDEFVVSDLLEKGIVREKINSPQYLDNLIISLVTNVREKKKGFYQHLVTKTLTTEKINVQSQEVQRSILRLANETFKRKVSIQNPNQEVLDILREILNEGPFPSVVEDYLHQIGARNVNDSTKKEMVRYLSELDIDPERFDLKNDDELVAIAYAHSIKNRSGREDPIDNIYTPGKKITWNYDVDYFDTVESQQISRESIIASGALDYIYELGERLGIFRTVDIVVLMWAQGQLDIAQSKASSKLYRYYKIREDRLSFEERAMVYKQILNKGRGQLLARMRPNSDFSRLWELLMNKVVDYIQRAESSPSINSRAVSRAGIFQAARNLQQNLSTYMVGKPFNDVHEMYSQLQECIDILREGEIVDQLGGGRRGDMWKVIENIAKQEFGAVPNVTAFRTIAVEGNKIFRWLADFNEQNTNDVVFADFLRSVETYVISQSDVESSLRPPLLAPRQKMPPQEEPDMDFEEMDESDFEAIGDDDFGNDDWN